MLLCGMMNLKYLRANVNISQCMVQKQQKVKHNSALEMIVNIISQSCLILELIFYQTSSLKVFS